MQQEMRLCAHHPISHSSLHTAWEIKSHRYSVNLSFTKALRCSLQDNFIRGKRLAQVYVVVMYAYKR